MRFLPVFIIFLLALTGCSSVPASFEDQKDTKEYQISAPWDEKMYDSFYKKVEKIIPDIENVKGGIVPHHLIAGHLDAVFFETIKKQNPSTVVLLGPNHFDRGHADIISTQRDWKTIYGNVETDLGLLQKLAKKRLVEFDEETVKEEHSIYSVIPFIKKSLPDAKVLPLILRGNIEQEKLDKLVKALAEMVPEDAVFVSSIDFSHDSTIEIADARDEFTIKVIKEFDFDNLEKVHVDSVPSLYVLMCLMENFGMQKVAHEFHTNSGRIVGKLDEEYTTSHYSPYFVKGAKEENRINF